MKFITVLALAACAVLVSAAPHGGSNGNTYNNDESNRELNVNDESETKITDNSATDVRKSNQNIEANNTHNKGGLIGGLANNLLGGGILSGNQISALGGSNKDTTIYSQKSDN